MRKKVKLNVILLMFLLAVLMVLVVLPEKSKADTYLPGRFVGSGEWGPICDCAYWPPTCACLVRVPLPAPGY